MVVLGESEVDQGRDDNEENQAADSDTAERLAGVGKEVANSLGTELVVNKTHEGDTVSESLEGGNGVMEDDHGCNDEENVLEDTGEGKDKSGCFSDLICIR